MSYTLVNKDELQNSGSTSEFEGYRHADTEVFFILVDMQPGEGIRLHTHPYQEIFILQEARLRIGWAPRRSKRGQGRSSLSRQICPINSSIVVRASSGRWIST